jgi:LysR family hydrogen peroxide-inducible transcriptional activator
MALPVAQEGLESRELYAEAFMVALPNHHPLTEKSAIKVADLKSQTLLLLEDGHCLREQALEVCSRVDIREPEDFRGTSLETFRQMVIAGLGVTLLPELAVESPFGSQRGLAIREFARPAPSRTVGAVWRKSSTRAAAISAVCDVLKHAVQ